VNLSDVDLVTTKACLLQLGSDLAELELRIRANQTKDAHWRARQLSDLRAQIGLVIAQIAALEPQSKTAPSSAIAERDRSWHALKAAIQTYRSVVSPANDHVHSA